MATPRKLLHDRTVLLLMATTILLGTGTAIYALLGISSASSVVVVRFRPTLVNAFSRGDSSELYSLVLFSIIMVASAIILPTRVYPVRRFYALTILILISIVLVMHSFVLGALLHLR